MSKPNDGPAFPTVYEDQQHQVGYTEPGMSLRDYFAAQMIQAQVTSTVISALMSVYFGEETAENARIGKALSLDRDECATAAYEWADAMVKARDQS